MFPSPQEQAMLKTMRKELLSGVTPHQFELDSLRYGELLDQAETIKTSMTRADLPERALRGRLFLMKTISGWMERVREYLKSEAPAR